MEIIFRTYTEAGNTNDGSKPSDTNLEQKCKRA